MAFNLTKQETKVAHLIANGFLAKEIAAKLFVSVLTIKTHTRNIRIKTGAKNIADITRQYILSLPKASDVFKVILFLVIQLNIIANNPDLDLRRGKRGFKNRVKTTKVLRN